MAKGARRCEGKRWVFGIWRWDFGFYRITQNIQIFNSDFGIPNLARLPFDELRPRVGRGELVEGRLPYSKFCPLTSVFCRPTSGFCIIKMMVDKRACLWHLKR